MKVLLLGSTGNVGSRLLSSLQAHDHELVLYVRNPAKLPQEVLTTLSSSNIVTGDAADTKAIADAAIKHNCEAIVSAAGIAGVLSKTEQFPAIFRAVIEAAASVGRERGTPIRCWLLAGLGLLDLPGTSGSKLISYLPLFRDHETNFATAQTISTNEAAWSILCPSVMWPSKEADATAQAKAHSAKLVAAADVPPNWSPSLSWVPLIGTFMNVMANANSYGATLEQAAEVLVRDLDQGLSSEFIGKRVGLKVTA